MRARLTLAPGRAHGHRMHFRLEQPEIAVIKALQLRNLQAGGALGKATANKTVFAYETKFDDKKCRTFCGEICELLKRN